MSSQSASFIDHHQRQFSALPSWNTQLISASPSRETLTSNQNRFCIVEVLDTYGSPCHQQACCSPEHLVSENLPHWAALYDMRPGLRNPLSHSLHIRLTGRLGGITLATNYIHYHPGKSLFWCSVYPSFLLLLWRWFVYVTPTSSCGSADFCSYLSDGQHSLDCVGMVTNR